MNEFDIITLAYPVIAFLIDHVSWPDTFFTRLPFLLEIPRTIRKYKMRIKPYVYVTAPQKIPACQM